MRLFFAIPLAADVQKALASHCEHLSQLLPEARFVRGDLMHITLHFVGEQTPAQADYLAELLCGNKPVLPVSFTVKTAKLGAFRSGHLHTLWMGLAAHHGFQQLHDSLLSLLMAVGYSHPGDRFVPHITLAREAVLAQPAGAYDRTCPMPPAAVPVRSVALFESLRRDGQLEYRPIATRPL